MKIVCIGRNYAAHAKELGNAIPEEPVFFMKPKTALNIGDKPFYYPEFTNELHYEAELVIKICKNGKYIQPKYAYQYYNQITVGIDFTARDIQNDLKAKGLPWEKAKAFDHSACIGKWIDVTNAHLEQPIPFSLKLNGNTVQQADSSMMIYSIPQILEEASRYFSLNIGDLVYTGTPAGVGECVSGDELSGYIGNDNLLNFTIK